MVNQGYATQGLAITIASLLRRFAPAIIVVVALLACISLYGIRKSQAYDALAIISGLLALILFRNGRQDELYVSRKIGNLAVAIAGNWFLLFGILLVLGYATKTSNEYSRKALFTWLIITPILVTIVQQLLDWIVFRTTLSTVNARRVVIAGANEIGRNVAEKIINHPIFAMRVVGFFDDRSAKRLGLINNIRMLGNLRDLPTYVRENQVDIIFISLPIRNVQRVSELLDELHDTTASIYYVPDVFVFDLIQCRTTDLDGVPIVSLCETPFYGSRGLAKRVSDIVISATIIVLTMPLMLLIAVLIKITSKGSVIFRQRRYGLDGQEIVVFKFRSMMVSEDGAKVQQATRNDIRLTPVGAFLRKYSLDELPQFFNVLQGQMSVVGPRPHAVAHNEEFRGLIKGYMIRHKVKPGITGLAQVRGYRGETITVDDMRKRVESDLEYLRNWSLGLDFRIILRTIGLIFADKAAY